MGLVVTGQEAGPEAHGTVNEVMIGIVDPNTNTVGYAAFIDPEEPSEDDATDTYAGWERVRSAAIAMAESANLLLMPGRLRSNGESAPSDAADWIEWTNEMRDAALRAYEAARAESQDTLLDISESLTAACSSCHARFLGGDDPAARCVP